MRLSKSAINSFKFCPFQWYMHYVKNWNPDPLPKAMTDGSEIHNTIDSVTKDVKSPKEFVEIISSFEDEHRHHYQNIAKYQSWNKLPIAHELRLYDDELDFIGIIDRIQVTKEGFIAVVDYKTGKPHEVKYYEFELNIYAHLIKKYLGIVPTKGFIIFTGAGIISDYVDITPLSMNSACVEVEAYRNKIKEATDKQDFPRCGKCETCKTFPTLEAFDEKQKPDK